MKTPSVLLKDGFIPDLNSRYFIADFSYGLSILVQIANLLNIDTPFMKKTLTWYVEIAEKKEMFDFKEFGINDKQTFEEFYMM